MISSNDDSPGKRPTFVILTIGNRPYPSALTMPPGLTPAMAALSRPVKTPVHMPSLTMSTLCAGVPSSSYLNVANAPGKVASATMFINVDPYLCSFNLFSCK